MFCLITNDCTASGLGLYLVRGTVSAGLAFINKKDVLVLLVTCLLTLWVTVWGSDRYLSCGSLSALFLEFGVDIPVELQYPTTFLQH